MLKNASILMLGLFILAPKISLAGYTLDDVKKIRNDKEPMISSIKKKEIERIKQKFPDPTTNSQNISLFYSVIQDFLNKEYQGCEFNLVERLISNLSANQESLKDTFKMLRVNHAIDDILYDILVGTTDDYFNIKALSLTSKSSGVWIESNKALDKNDPKELLAPFAKWPDETNTCVYVEYYKLKQSVRIPNEKARTRLSYLGTVLEEGYRQKIIDVPTFNKLEYLRSKSSVNTRDASLREYFNIIFKAKNKLIPKNQNYVVKDLEKENNFSSTKIKRFSKLTRRKLLYRKYNETQIIMLAQILQKASRRMGTDPDTESGVPFINQEFKILNANGERETYVEKIELDPQSQFNLARRLLRKDILTLQMMDTFNKVDITHNDVVMAALETGYISMEDLEYVIKYDDLWNPEISTFEKIKNFVFVTAGYGTFFLPPPYNLYVSLALTVVEGIIDDKTTDGASNDNPATFIE